MGFNRDTWGLGLRRFSPDNGESNAQEHGKSSRNWNYMVGCKH